MLIPVDNQGWLPGIAHLASPNYDQRPDATDRDTLRRSIDLIVVHAISLPPGEFGSQAIEDFFLNRLNPAAHPYFADIAALKVSAHFLIQRDGNTIQFVSADQRAWHAGVSRWDGRERCNDFSIGIELEGCDDKEFEEVQYRALNNLITRLEASYPIKAVVGHSDIAPGRKTDPGPKFDWSCVTALKDNGISTTHANSQNKLMNG